MDGKIDGEWPDHIRDLERERDELARAFRNKTRERDAAISEWQQRGGERVSVWNMTREERKEYMKRVPKIGGALVALAVIWDRLRDPKSYVFAAMCGLVGVLLVGPPELWSGPAPERPAPPEALYAPPVITPPRPMPTPTPTPTPRDEDQSRNEDGPVAQGVPAQDATTPSAEPPVVPPQAPEETLVAEPTQDPPPPEPAQPPEPTPSPSPSPKPTPPEPTPIPELPKDEQCLIKVDLEILNLCLQV